MCGVVLVLGCWWFCVCVGCVLLVVLCCWLFGGWCVGLIVGLGVGLSEFGLLVLFVVNWFVYIFFDRLLYGSICI